MKAALLLLMLSLVLATAASAASVVGPGTAESRTSISVVPTRYDPYPAESGRYLRLWIKVENLGTLSENGRFILESGYPFSLDPSTPAEQSLGTLEPGRQFVLEYKLLVDALALTSDYNNSVWLKQCFDTACASYARWPVSIFVRRPNPILDIASAISSPSPIVAGRQFNLTITLQSTGSRVKDVVAELNLSDTPFGALGAATKRQVESIGAGENASRQFELIAMGSAVSDTYKVPVAISYSDEVGNSFEKTDLLTLLVGGAPSVYIAAEDTAAFRKGSVTDFIVSIVNRGLVDVKLLSMRLLPGSGYRILSPADMYIGALESDDYETAKFKIFVEGSNQTTLSFELSYMDALNNEYNETRELTYAVLSDEEAARFGLYKPDSGWIFLIVLGLLVVYAIYRVKRKKK